jgi:hypothetical protein
VAQMKDLQSKKPKGKADEPLLLEIERLESSLVVARDDLVGVWDQCKRSHSEPPPERCATP